MPENKIFLIGEIYNMKFQGKGSAQSGWRPGLVFQNNVGNAKSPNIIALPLTSSLKKMNMPTHVFVSSSDTGLKKDSLVLCENPETVSKEDVGVYITTLSEDYMKKIAVASLLSMAAISFLDKEALITAWEKTLILNLVG